MITVAGIRELAADPRVASITFHPSGAVAQVQFFAVQDEKPDGDKSDTSQEKPSTRGRKAVADKVPGSAGAGPKRQRRSPGSRGAQGDGVQGA